MKLFKRALSILLTIVVIGSLFTVWFQRQAFYDWYRLRDYSPPAEVSRLADRTTMTPEARRLFYINRPVIASKQEFAGVCSKETTIVLGCYIQNRGIYIYDVTDPRLAGVKEVTAAHEMLHAVYDRLSDKERQNIDRLTQSAFESVTSTRVKENVERYRQEDPGVVPNELHSILPTEVRNLPPELEVYYQQYFQDRQAVVAYSEQYEAEFDTRVAQVEAYDRQLADLRGQIEANKRELDSQYLNLQVRKNELDALRASGSIAEYNAAVPGFNARVNTYNVTVSSADQLISRYNAIVEKRNATSIDIQNLAEAIDSRPQSF